MHSQLWHNDDNSYRYTQKLKSSVFFLPFTQIEESDFYLQDGQIVCQKYHVQREGLDGPCYTVVFGERFMEVAVVGQDDLSHYEMPEGPIHDKLVTQLVLIRQIIGDSAPGDRTVCFVDPKGIHERVYTLHNQDEILVFRSDYGNKSSAFTLDPKRRYLPVLFEQYRHGSLILTGELQDCQFGTAWDDFLGS